jgi:hypothetical protein
MQEAKTCDFESLFTNVPPSLQFRNNAWRFGVLAVIFNKGGFQ